MGNIVKEPRPAAGGELCRALSHRIDPEKLKEMGNEEYRQGHYTEAVALYDQAIIMDARRPAYWSNKAAALAALGRLIEAVGDCKEAVRIDPSYDRAHHRFGGLYLRYVGHLADFHPIKKALQNFVIPLRRVTVLEFCFNSSSPIVS
jgi:DnaJ family protein C protein 7